MSTLSKKGVTSRLLFSVLAALLLIVVIIISGVMLSDKVRDVFSYGEKYCRETQLTVTQMGERLEREYNADALAEARIYYDGAVSPCFGPEDIPLSEESLREEIFCDSAFEGSEDRDLNQFRERCE